MEIGGVRFSAVWKDMRLARKRGFFSIGLGATPVFHANFGAVSKRRSIRKFGAGVIAVTPDFGTAPLAEIFSEKHTRPFVVVADFGVDAAEQERRAVALRAAARSARAPWALAISTSGPDVRTAMPRALEAAASLNVPLLAYVSMSVSPDDAADIARDPNCAGMLLSGSMQWGEMPERARRVFFRKPQSAFPDTGLVFGKYLRPLMLEWLEQYRRKFSGKPVIAAGGILCPDDASQAAQLGAQAVVLDAAIRLRPWNISRIAKRMHALIH